MFSIRKFYRLYQKTHCLKSLDKLQKIIFYIYLKRNYAEQYYQYEKDLYFSSADAINSILRIKKTDEKISIQLNKIYEIIISLASLRYRIKDHTTFEVCEKELFALTTSISNNINDLINLIKKKPTKHDLKNMRTSIKGFNKIYENTLQLVTNEPVQFLIFICGLKDLYKSFKKSYEIHY